MTEFSPCGHDELRAVFGNLDIYVFDQMLRGRITPRMRVLDAGCGAGRNSQYLMACGTDVSGVDQDPDQIERIRALAAECAPGLPSDRFRVGSLTALPFPDASFDAVICNAVLHFAEDESEFVDMVGELWRVLGDGGVFFARLASSIGIEHRIEPLSDRWHRLPDGTDRFLVDQAYLAEVASGLGAELLDPLKTTIVQDLRAMSTWVLGKGRRE